MTRTKNRTIFQNKQPFAQTNFIISILFSSSSSLRALAKHSAARKKLTQWLFHGMGSWSLAGRRFKANSMHKSSVVCWKCCHDMPKCTIFNRVVGLVLASYNSVLWKIWIDLFGWNACNVRTLHTKVTLPPSPPQRTSRVMYECNNRCVHAYPKNWDGKSEKKIARFTWAQHTFLPSVCVCVWVYRVVSCNSTCTTQSHFY